MYFFTLFKFFFHTAFHGPNVLASTISRHLCLRTTSFIGNNLNTILRPYDVTVREFVEFSDIQLRRLRKRVEHVDLEPYRYTVSFIMEMLVMLDQNHADSDILSSILDYMCCS
jgi:hypothetical protein